MTIEEIRTVIKSIAPDAITHVCNADNEESLEWICDRGRLGFVLDNENTSSWFMVTEGGNKSKSGAINDAGIELVQELANEFAVKINEKAA
jgi:hypothetical protein